jgi:hypothetical protein
MLFRTSEDGDGGNRVRVLIPKARYGIPDVERGETLQIDPDTCTIADMEDKIGDTKEFGSKASMTDMFDSIENMNEGKGAKPDKDFEQEVGISDNEGGCVEGVDDARDDFMFENLVPDGDLMSEEEAGDF